MVIDIIEEYISLFTAGLSFGGEAAAALLLFSSVIAWAFKTIYKS